MSGYKTYIFAALGGLTAAAYFLNYIDATMANMLLAIFGFGGLAALRSGVSKLQ